MLNVYKLNIYIKYNDIGIVSMSQVQSKNVEKGVVAVRSGALNKMTKVECIKTHDFIFIKHKVKFNLFWLH